MADIANIADKKALDQNPKEQDKLEPRYEKILDDFFSHKEEAALFEISELGKEMVMARQGPDLLLAAHADCLKKLLKDIDPLIVSKFVVNANEILLNGIMAYAMNYYNFIDILDNQKKNLQEANLKLEEANLKLKELDRLKSVFIASISHELTTPLNSIIDLSGDLLEEWSGPLNNEQKENITQVVKAGEHLLDLVNNIVDLSNIEAGKTEIEMADFDLFELITETTDLLAGEVRKKGLELMVKPMHQMMRTDRQRLRQCLINLISNALRFTSRGYIKIEAVEVEVDDQKKTVAIAIEDSGLGIKEGDKARLFQSFVRFELPQKSDIIGPGLELYLTNKIVTEILKGEILVESVYGKGSKFSILIPVDIRSAFV